MIANLNRRIPAYCFALLLAAAGAQSQTDPLQEAGQALKESTGGKALLTFEERTRWEEKFGVNFGKTANQQYMLGRTRIGFGLSPAPWLTVYAMGQDSRVPFYGTAAPSTMRDTIDLQEAYVKLFDQKKTGFGATFGRSMLDYGESRVLGNPEWLNATRAYDRARLYYRTRTSRLEVLMAAPVKFLPDCFNRPNLGERIWGTYDTFSRLRYGASIDVYALRHTQNRIGGWTGPGTLGTNSFGARLFGPVPSGFAYSLEAIGQTGHVGPLPHRAYAWFAGLSQKTVRGGHPFTSSVEFKGASGTRLGASGSGTYDQLSPANHDKFGHLDLFGWRNLETFKAMESLGISKRFTLNAMYTDHWLFSPADSLYNSQGSSLAVSKNGTAGTHVGRELDGFVTYKWGLHTFGAGVGHFFRGEFIENTTPHVNPRYLYLFQQYAFK